jgi:hypothetical protein
MFPLPKAGERRAWTSPPLRIRKPRDRQICFHKAACRIGIRYQDGAQFNPETSPEILAQGPSQEILGSGRRAHTRGI